MNTKKEKIKNYLENNDINPTYQRIVIMKYLEDSENHPTAEQIYKDIKNKIPTISKTTVYNSLKIFTEKDIIKQLNVAGNINRYEHRTEIHDHFLCLNCGEIYDIKPEHSLINGKQSMIEGNKISDYECLYKGICRECIDKNNT